MTCFFKGFSQHALQSLQHANINPSVCEAWEQLIQSQLVTDTLTTDYTVGDAQRLIAIADASIRRRLESHPSGLNHIPTYLTVKGMRPAQALAVLTRNETEPVKAEVYAIAQQVIERLNRIASAERIAQAAEALPLVFKAVEKRQSIQENTPARADLRTNMITLMQYQLERSDDEFTDEDRKRGNAIVKSLAQSPEANLVKSLSPSTILRMGAVAQKMDEEYDALREIAMIAKSRLLTTPKNKHVTQWKQVVVEQGHIVGLSIDGGTELRQQLSLLKRLPHLRTLKITNIRNSTDLEGLAHLPRLMKLDLEFLAPVLDPLDQGEGLAVIGMLHDLRSLAIKGNENLSGTIPDSWRNLSHIENVTISSTSLTGEFPAAILHMPKLKELVLDGNRFEGAIPSQLGQCANLEKIVLRGNAFSGEIPDLSRLTNLKVLDVAANNFEGYIPFWITLLKKVEDLDFSRNQFSGSCPPGLNRMPSLRKLAISHNRLTTIPHMPQSLPRGFRILDAENNPLTGSYSREMEDWLLTVNITVNTDSHFKRPHKQVAALVAIRALSRM